MPPIPFADNFLAGSLLTILMPLSLVAVLTIWYTVAARRVPEDTPASAPTLPPSEVVEAAGPAVAHVTPAGAEGTPADPAPTDVRPTDPARTDVPPADPPAGQR